MVNGCSQHYEMDTKIVTTIVRSAIKFNTDDTKVKHTNITSIYKDN